MIVVRVRGANGYTIVSTSCCKRHECDLRQSSWLDNGWVGGNDGKLSVKKEGIFKV